MSAYPGLLQPLPIPDRVWSDVFVDFIEGLSKSEGKDVIMVVVDRLSKYAHFLTLIYPFTALQVAQVYKLHGSPTNIVFNKDKIFLKRLMTELFKLMGTELKNVLSLPSSNEWPN